MTTPLKILAKYRKRLKTEISRKTDAFNVLFMANNRMKGNFTDEDLIELRGYYKGLKVAKEVLDRTIAEYKEKATGSQEDV